jgi:UDP-2,3-diacylglucosamine hydrolase
LQEFKSPVCFLSDCHLPLIPKKGRENWITDVVRFLRDIASQNATIFLVGDLFDFWFEWKHSIPGKAFSVLSELRKLVEADVKIVYLSGNHDGHLGSFLENEVGLTVSRKPIDVLIDGKKFHIIHGDGIAPQDTGYRILRSLVRWGPTEKIYKFVHPDFGIWFADKVSAVSHSTGGNKAARQFNDYKEYAMKKLDDGFNFVVMGHVHKSRYVPHDNGGFMAIGDWMGKKSYGIFSGDELRLLYFNNDAEQDGTEE